MPGFATTAQLLHVVEAAGLAPSVHNTQPWRFAVRPQGLELYADPDRRLAVLDPDARQLHLSCGAALFHARVAARAVGLQAIVRLLPEPRRPELLAELVLTPGRAPSTDETTLAAAILRRHTYRRAFEDRPVDAALLDRLRLGAEREGAVLHLVSRRDQLVELEVLLSRADADQEHQERYRDELRHWVHADPAVDGIPVDALAAAAGSSLRQRDFTPPHAPAPGGSAPVADHPAVVVLVTEQDDPLAWLRAGQALGAVLLAAAAAGVQAQPLGQVTDTMGYRLRLRSVLRLVGQPQLVLRMGYGSAAAATPRRAVEDLLAPVAR